MPDWSQEWWAEYHCPRHLCDWLSQTICNQYLILYLRSLCKSLCTNNVMWLLTMQICLQIGGRMFTCNSHSLQGGVSYETWLPSTTSNLCHWNQVFKDKVKSYCVCNYYVVEFKKEHYFFSFSMSPLKSLKLIFQSQEIPQRVLPLHLVCRHQKGKRSSHLQHQRSSNVP